jgi:hypothetical protein
MAVFATVGAGALRFLVEPIAQRYQQGVEAIVEGETFVDGSETRLERFVYF